MFETSKLTQRFRFKALILFLAFPLICSISPCSFGDETPKDNEWEQLEKWFDDDWEKKAQSVNDGELKFLTPLFADPLHQIEALVTISETSLSDGWVNVRQCHIGLDAVPASEVRYGYRAMRNLRIESTNNIRKSWVEDKSVQMQFVEQNARVCVTLEAQILLETKPGIWSLKQGPFYRRFFDGYYPMRVKTVIAYAPPHLRFDHTSLPPQKGLTIKPFDDRVEVEAIFEGRFEILFFFHSKKK